MSGNLFGRGGEFSSPTREDTIEEYAQLMRKAAEPARIGERTETQQARAAQALGMTRNQVKKAWYRERRKVEAHELLRARLIVARLEDARARRQQLRRDIRDQISPLDERDAGPLVGMARAPGLDTD